MSALSVAARRRLTSQKYRAYSQPSDEGPQKLSSPTGVSVVRMPRNVGYAGGMNAGIRHFLARRPDWILLLTNDVRFHPSAVARLLEAARTSDGYGLWVRPCAGLMSVLYYGGRWRQDGRLTFNWTAPSDIAKVVEVDWVPGAVLLARREVFEQVGLLG